MSELSYLEKLLDGAEVEWLPLGVLGELVRGNGLPKTDFTEAGIPAIHYGQIYTFYGLSTETTKSFVSQDTAKKLKKVNTGDVVITNTSENLDDVGKALVYLGKEQAVTGGHATIFKPREGIIGKYFAYFTQTNSFYNEKRKYSKGTKVIDVSASDMAKIIIPIPCPNNPEKSLAIQSEIVRILDKFTALTAELTAELNMRKKQYNYYRDQLLSFDEAEVEWKTLADVAILRRGRVMSKGYLEQNAGDYPVYSSQTARNGMIGSIDTYDFDGEFISWTTDGANAGTVFYRTGKFSITNVCGLIKIHENYPISYKYLYYWLSIEAQKHVYSGMGNPKLMSHQVEKITVPIPFPASPEKSMLEQQRIVGILDKLEAITFSLTEGLPREIELRQKQYEYYRDLLFSFPKPEAASN
ncbi:TPA: restriction endonuclease subunit S [Enterobacter hormaechei]|nr:restriction endonuclease subunit S [Salmonella enterica subsp. enterica serovar Typhimurium]ELD6820087.1 restriction endonuclease subunit S [Enterobacter hormaechei]HCD6987674.1 restriction endonuclease subunit S [Enterobacter hormaechei]